MLYVGIDQHRKQLTVSIRDESGNIVLRRQVSTEWKKVRAFFDEVRELATAHDGYLAVVEICGFNHWLLKLLPEHGCHDAIVVQPGEQSTHKTDRRDANGLSEVLWIASRKVCRCRGCAASRSPMMSMRPTVVSPACDTTWGGS